jgi:hypothetical protein
MFADANWTANAFGAAGLLIGEWHTRTMRLLARVLDESMAMPFTIAAAAVGNFDGKRYIGREQVREGLV